MPLQLEHLTQSLCVNLFRNEWPDLEGLLVAVPNGGRRTKGVAKKMKAEGVVRGVADMLLFVARGGYYGLCIEFKTEDGRQSPAQKAWQKKVELQGYRYIIVRDPDSFINNIAEYLDMPRSNNAIATGQVAKGCQPTIVNPKRRKEITLEDLLK